MEIISSMCMDVKVENLEQYYASHRYAECRLCKTITNFVRPLRSTFEKYGLLQTVQKTFPQINVDEVDNSMICDSCLTSLLEVDFQNNKSLTNIIDIDKKEIADADESFYNDGFETIDIKSEAGTIESNTIKTEELDIKDECETVIISDDECDDKNGYCDYVIESSYALQRHTLYIHEKNGEVFQCDQCKYKTFNKDYLTTHKERHLGKYRYPCQYCDSGFDSRLSIHNHILNSHPKMDYLVTSKILQCEFCEYRSVFNSKMYLHKLKHTKDHAQSLKCSNCKFFTYNKYTLLKHMWRHTKRSKPRVCKLCKKDFTEKYKLDGHLLSKHGDNAELLGTITSRIHYCKKCPYKCVRLAHFQRHLRTHKNK